MAQLDPLLRALLDQQAQELVLDDGKQPAFLFGDRLKPVSKQALTQRQITVLLAELADQVEAAKLSQGIETRFVYRHPEGEPFVCDVRRSDGGLCARLSHRREAVAEVAPTTPTPTPSRPAAAAVAAGPGIGIDPYLRKMVELGASDLHLSAQEVPMVRLHGEMTPLPGGTTLEAERTRELLEEMMPERNLREFAECHDTDFAYEIAGVARFRANVFMDRKGPGGVFRIIPSDILSAEQLGLPAAILDMCKLSKGLVLVTGPTGSGKSTTLAAMIDHINKTRSEHIITIEDPIEFVHPNQKCLVNQREIITHTAGFKPALRAALREDPDIVLVGEMRDLETIAIAIETAETGHLVFGTLHTTTACSTVDRIIDQFPADRQQQIRTMLATSLKGVVAQTLLKKIGGGRVAALEVLVVNPAISNLVREGKTFQIPSLMQTGRNAGMRLLNDALMDLVTSKQVEPEEAYRKAVDKGGLATLLGKAGIRVDTSVE